MKFSSLPLVCTVALLFALALNPNARAQPSPPATTPVQVLVLGTFHLSNPGQDLHNLQVDDVRTPEKQKELTDLAERLAKFKPTKIAVEALSDRPDFGYAKYESFTPEALTKNADERVQIGFRLAKNLGHQTVYGIDEQSDTIDYFPFDKVDAYAKAHAESATLEKMHAYVQTMMKALEAQQKTTPISTILAETNAPAKVLSDHRAFYYALLRLGDAKTQPGADLNGGWYLRNAKIFAKLQQVAKPGDRIVVIFGAGHNYWLRHFVRETPGFQLVEAETYLK